MRCTLDRIYSSLGQGKFFWFDYYCYWCRDPRYDSVCNHGKTRLRQHGSIKCARITNYQHFAWSWPSMASGKFSDERRASASDRSLRLTVCCIFPISPMITKKILLKSLKVLNRKKFNYVFPVTKYTNSNQNKLFVSNDKITKDKKNSRTFFDAGQFYWGTVKAWKKKFDIFGDKSGIIHLSSKKFVDVNNSTDWKILEKIIKNEKKRKNI